MGNEGCFQKEKQRVVCKKPTGFAKRTKFVTIRHITVQGAKYPSVRLIASTDITPRSNMTRIVESKSKEEVPRNKIKHI